MHLALKKIAKSVVEAGHVEARLLSVESARLDRVEGTASVSRE